MKKSDRELLEDEDPEDEEDFDSEDEEGEPIVPESKKSVKRIGNPPRTPSIATRPEVLEDPMPDEPQTKTQIVEREINLSLINDKLNWIIGYLSKVKG